MCPMAGLLPMVQDCGAHGGSWGSSIQANKFGWKQRIRKKHHLLGAGKDERKEKHKKKQKKKKKKKKKHSDRSKEVGPGHDQVACKLLATKKYVHTIEQKLCGLHCVSNVSSVT